MWIEISGISCSQFFHIYFDENSNERQILNSVLLRPNFLMVVAVTPVVAILF